MFFLFFAELPNVERCRHYKMQRFGGSNKPRRKKRGSGKWEEGSDGEENEKVAEDRDDDRSGTDMEGDSDAMDSDEATESIRSLKSAAVHHHHHHHLQLNFSKKDNNSNCNNGGKDEDDKRLFKKSHNYFKSKFLYPAESSAAAASATIKSEDTC